MTIMNRKIAVLSISLALALAPFHTVAAEETSKQSHSMDDPAGQLHCALRKLWIEHVFWTRSYIVSAVANLPDKEEVLERLLKNQDDIGKAIEPYYGEKAGKQLAGLLREHILLAGSVLEAAKEGNEENLKKFNAQWYKNADDIAQFLSKANPNWSFDELKELLYMHLAFVTEQVTTRIKQDWAAEINSFDEGEDHIIKLADTLTRGILQQFPSKF